MSFTFVLCQEPSGVSEAPYARDPILEQAWKLGIWGAGACPVSPLLCRPAGLPLSARERKKRQIEHSVVVLVPCHMTTFVFGGHNSPLVHRN